LTTGIAEIGLAQRNGLTRLVHLYQRDPLRVLFPAPAASDPVLAVIVTTSGGLVAGDHLGITVSLAPGAAAHVTTSAAEKIYRSTGKTTTIDQEIAVGAGAVLEYLPPETILFDGARLRRETTIDLAPGAGFLGGEIVVLGRRARGERFTSGLFREVWQVRCAGVLIWGDALHLEDDVGRTINDPACFDGAGAFATMISRPPSGDVSRLVRSARAVQSGATVPGVQAGVTGVAGLCIARWLAADAASLRRVYADLACHLRSVMLGLPPRLPRIWHV